MIVYGKSFKAIGLMVCLVGVTKRNCKLALLILSSKTITGVKGREYGQCGVNPYSHVFNLHSIQTLKKARDVKQLLK